MRSQEQTTNLQNGCQNTSETVSEQSKVEIEATTNKNKNWNKIQALKERKLQLEKLLSEKNILLQQIQKQEAQIINASYNNKESCSNNTENENSTLRRKIGTNLKSKDLMSYKDQQTAQKLLQDKKFQQDICNAAFKLANDPSISKSIRQTHKAEYDAAQNKLIGINHNLSLLKTRPLGQPTNRNNNAILPSSSSVSTTALNLTKSPTIVHYTGESPTTTSKTKYETLNAINDYYIPERRNSIKSMKIPSTKHNDGYNNTTTHFDRTLKTHRSDYDINRLVVNSSFHSNENNNSTNNSSYGNYIHSQHQQQQNRYSSPRSQHKYNDNDINRTYNQDLTDFGYNNLSTNIKYNSNRISGNLDKISGVIRQQNYNPHTNIDDQQYHYIISPNDKNKYVTLNNNNTRRYINDDFDITSIRPTIVDREYNQPQLTQQSGLGGYWRTLANNERVWCPSDSNSNELLSAQQQTKIKKTNPAAPTKSSSLGNFESMLAKDEMTDKISISSMSSETSKKPKEKQWLETSLDGPLIKTKTPNIENNPRSLALYSYNMSPPITSLANLPPTNHHHTISPTYNNYNLNSGHHHHYTHKHHNYRERNTKLSSQSMSNNSYRLPSTKIEDQINLSQSTSILNPENSDNILGSQLSGIIIQKNITSPPTGQYNLNVMTTKNNRISVGNISKDIPDIRIESPKNMTVVQQAIIVPYKEVTKPFEMSDFYKYSTKFRQKDCNKTSGQLGVEMQLQ